MESAVVRVGGRTGGRGKEMAEEIFGEAFVSAAVVGGDGFFASVVDAEVGMFPRKEVSELFRADELVERTRCWWQKGQR